MTNALNAMKAYGAIQDLMGGAGAKKAQTVSAPSSDDSFGGELDGALSKLDQVMKNADGQAFSLASGGADVTSIVTAVAEAETAMQTLTAVRDRVIAAYEEIMRMPI